MSMSIIQNTIYGQELPKLPTVDASGVLVDGKVVFGNLKFEIHRVDIWSKLDNETPDNDLFLVVVGSITPTNNKRACLKKRDFELRIGVEKYSADTLSNLDAAEEYDIRFPQSFFDHCVKRNKTEYTFLLFDIEEDSGSVNILFDRTQKIAIASSLSGLIAESGFERSRAVPIQEIPKSPTHTSTPTRAVSTQETTKSPTHTSTPIRVVNSTPTPTSTPTNASMVTAPGKSGETRQAFPIAGVAIESGNLYGGPDVAYGAVAGIFSDTEVTIIGASDDGQWYQLEGNYWINGKSIELNTIKDEQQARNTTSATPIITPTGTPIPVTTPTSSAVALSQRTYDEQVYMEEIVEVILGLNEGVTELGELLNMLSDNEYLILSSTWKSGVLDAATKVSVSKTYIDYMNPPDRYLDFHYEVRSAATTYYDGTVLWLDAVDTVDVNKATEGTALLSEAKVSLERALLMIDSETDPVAISTSTGTPISEQSTALISEDVQYSDSSDGYGSGGLGLSRNDWEKTHRESKLEVTSYGTAYDNRHDVYFQLDESVWMIETFWNKQDLSTPDIAMSLAQTLIPFDSQFIQTYSPANRPETIVHLYYSESLKGRFSDLDSFTGSWWTGGESGNFIIQYNVYEEEPVTRMIISLGNNP